jgi:hypothetical protein
MRSLQGQEIVDSGNPAQEGDFQLAFDYTFPPQGKSCSRVTATGSGVKTLAATAANNTILRRDCARQ